MTTTKEELVNNIKNWLALENEIKVLQKEIKQRREKRKGLTDALVEIMKTNDIDCFDISEGKLIYTKNNVKSGITKQFLMDMLKKYFDDNPDVDSDDLGQFILDNRKIDIKENLRHKPNNNK